MKALKIAIAGAGGRMGRMLLEVTLKDSQATLAAAIDQPGAPLLGKDAGEIVGSPCGVMISSDSEAGIAQASCLIDFTRPEGYPSAPRNLPSAWHGNRHWHHRI
jgi:4-hydroxy-tetrahydrodipicolinate reductase